MRNSLFASTAATAALASGLMGQPALGNQPTGTFNALGTQSPSGPACASSNPYLGSAGTFQEWMIRFLEHRIGDRRIIRLIQKWLKAGVLEDGVVSVSEKGTGQGSVISPLLANIYLHYALDLWVKRWRLREATGDMIIVRYADDFIVGFQHASDARRFLDEMRKRLDEFALSLHPEKTRLIEFGRFAAERRKRRGLGKPETFNFLGFTFVCGKTRSGKFQLQRRTRRDRMRAKLREIKETLRRCMHRLIPEQGKWLGHILRGYFNSPHRSSHSGGFEMSPELRISHGVPLYGSARIWIAICRLRVEAQVQGAGRVPERYEPATTIALAALILSAAKFAWDIYRDIKKDSKATPAREVIARRMRLELAAGAELNSEQSDRVIAVVVDELMNDPPAA